MFWRRYALALGCFDADSFLAPGYFGGHSMLCYVWSLVFTHYLYTNYYATKVIFVNVNLRRILTLVYFFVCQYGADFYSFVKTAGKSFATIFSFLYSFAIQSLWSTLIYNIAPNVDCEKWRIEKRSEFLILLFLHKLKTNKQVKKYIFYIYLHFKVLPASVDITPVPLPDSKFLRIGLNPRSILEHKKIENGVGAPAHIVYGFKVGTVETHARKRHSTKGFVLVRI